MEAQWDELRSKNPAGKNPQLLLVQPHDYRQGELIQLERSFPQIPGVAGARPQEQWQAAGFLLYPGPDCGSLQTPCNGNTRFRLVNARYSEGSQHIALNSFAPALPPGHYRTTALWRKLVLISRDPMSASYGYPTPQQYVVSNDVEFDVVPASTAWIRQTLAASVAILRAPLSMGVEGYVKRQTAAQQLGFLNDPVAWRAALDLLPQEENNLLSTLSTHDPVRLCQLMQSRIAAPEQAVSSNYLSTMMQVCELAYLAPPPIISSASKAVVGAVFSATPPPRVAVPIDPQLSAYFQKQAVYRRSFMNEAAKTLGGSLTKKKSEPKTIALATLLNHIQQVRYAQPPEPDPAWAPIMKREFIQSFSNIEVAPQQFLLSMFVGLFPSPEIVPLLEAILDRWKAGAAYETAHAALRALNKIDPKRAQSRMVAELGKDRTWLDTQLLDLLPASAVPSMDDALITSLALAQLSGGWNPTLRMAALAKYATAQSLPRLKAVYESQQSCQPELVAYFVRADPAYADKLFRSSPWNMQKPVPRCAVDIFLRTSPLAMHPVLEKYMVAYLMHSEVHVKTVAAQALGRYGSKTVQLPLWDSFRYFHEYWKGKEAQLAVNGEGVVLEAELRNAIARGRNWLTTDTDLRTIASLCISERCRADTAGDLRIWLKPLRIEIMDPPNGSTVAQYYGLEGVEAVEAKLSQFPTGTQFVLTARIQDASAQADRIRAFASGHGLVVTLVGRDVKP